MIYENRWVLGLVDAWRHDGARLIADGGLSAGELTAALDATEVSYPAALLTDPSGQANDEEDPWAY